MSDPAHTLIQAWRGALGATPVTAEALLSDIIYRYGAEHKRLRAALTGFLGERPVLERAPLLDEALHRCVGKRFATCDGTASLVRVDQGWRVEVIQFDLPPLLVPEEDVVALMRAWTSACDGAPQTTGELLTGAVAFDEEMGVPYYPGLCAALDRFNIRDGRDLHRLLESLRGHRVLVDGTAMSFVRIPDSNPTQWTVENSD